MSDKMEPSLSEPQVKRELNEQELDDLWDNIFEALRNAPSREEMKKKSEALMNGWKTGAFTEYNIGRSYGDLILHDSTVAPAAFEVISEMVPGAGEVLNEKWLTHELKHYNKAKEFGLEAFVVVSFGIDGKSIRDNGDVSWNIGAGLQPSIIVKFPEGLSTEEKLRLTKEMAAAPDELSEQDTTQINE